jgi:ribonuclease P protein component
MLPKSERLTKEDFKTLKTKIVYRGILFDVAKTSHKKALFACVISKKTLKKAVDRNKAKRRIYSLLKEKDLDPTISLIVYPKKESITIPFIQLKEELKKVFATLH